MFTSIECTFLYIMTMIDNPILTSAAATTMIKKTKIWASELLCILLKVTISRFTAFSINSIHIRIMIAFRRINTPMTPIQNKARLKNR